MFLSRISTPDVPVDVTILLVDVDGDNDAQLLHSAKSAIAMTITYLTRHGFALHAYFNFIMGHRTHLSITNLIASMMPMAMVPSVLLLS